MTDRLLQVTTQSVLINLIMHYIYIYIHLHINACSVCMTACANACMHCVCSNDYAGTCARSGGGGGTKKEKQTEGNQPRGI